MSDTSTVVDAGAEDRELVAEDRRLLIHPYLPTSTADRVVMVEGDGCWLTDARPVVCGSRRLGMGGVSSPRSLRRR